MQQPDPGQHANAFPHQHNHSDPIHLTQVPPAALANGAHPPPHHLARPPLPASYSTSQALAQQRQQYHPHHQQQQQQQQQGFHPAQPFMHAPPPHPQQQPQDTRTQLFVSNLPFRARWQDLKDLMRKCGTVLRADVALNPTDGRSRGFGVVLFAKADDAAKAIATYHGYTWQTRVLDVRIDAQDPTGALALAEANRQQAIQNQQKLLEQRARNSPVPPPPPPPPPPQPPMGLVAAPYGSMLVPVPGAMGQAFLAAAAPPPPPPPPALPSHPAPSAPGSESAPSPYLSPAVVRTGSHDTATRRSPSPAPSPTGPPSSSSPASTLATPVDLSPSVTARDSLLGGGGGGKRPTPPLASRSPLMQHQGLPALQHQQQQPRQQAGGYGPGQGQGQGQDIPPQLQHALALVAPPPPPPPPPVQQLGHHHPHHLPHHQQQQPMLMMSIHPMGYAVPGGLVSYYAAAPQGGPARPGSAPPHLHGGMGMGHGPGPGMGMGSGGGAGPPGGPGYTNRHLFVGNLPFNCQWQELKDLMRGAGSVLRADIAQGPDGRSRGFGSVLFATSQDAERAVTLFNGHEFNGRTLKVHFDKFAGAAVNNNNNLPPHGHNHLHQQHHQPHYGGHHGPPPPPPPPYISRQQQQQQQQQHDLPVPIPYRPQTLEHLVGPSPLSSLAHSSDGQGASSRPGTAVARPGSSEDREAHSPAMSAAQKAPSPPAGSPLPDASQGITAPTATEPPSQPPPFFSRGHSNPAAPSRIAMPPPLPFSLAGLGHHHSSAAPHSAGIASPFSPMRTAGLPPMTPSMPAFTFGGAGPFAAQPTPPLLPHGMFSPGVGPFSPVTPGGGGGGGGMSPFFGPGGAWGNVAPGQQTPGGFNPMFPAYPYTPGHHLPQHAMQQQQQQQYAAHPQLQGVSAAEGDDDEATQYAVAPPAAGAVGEDSTYGEASPDKTPQADEPSYFPPVVAPASSAAVHPAGSASAPPLSPTLQRPSAIPTGGSGGAHGGGEGADGRPKSEGAVGALERALDSLSVSGAAHGGGGGTGGGAGGGGSRSLHSSPRVAPLIAPEPVHPATTATLPAPPPPPPVPAVGWAECSPPPPPEKELASAAGPGPRRASVDGGAAPGGKKPAFGTSIWG